MKKMKFIPRRVQLVVPETLRTRPLKLAHSSRLLGYSGQNRTSYKLLETYYQPQMTTSIAEIVFDCLNCAHNRVKLRVLLTRGRTPRGGRNKNFWIFPRGQKWKRKFRSVQTNNFTKLTEKDALGKITARRATVALCEVWIINYGIPVFLLPDNSSQFGSRLFQLVCKMSRNTNMYTSTQHSQLRGQVERCNFALTAMLRNYVNDHKDDCSEYASAPMYGYNCLLHRRTDTKPLDLILNRSLSDFTVHNSMIGRSRRDLESS